MLPKAFRFRAPYASPGEISMRQTGRPEFALHFFAGKTGKCVSLLVDFALKADPDRLTWTGVQGMKIFNFKRVPYAEIRAFSVHILTASGSFLAFLGVLAAAEKDFVSMFWWLAAALFVDGIDGPIARRVRVKEVLPNWSGDTLDNIIDYVTYVLLPAFALYQSGMIGEPWSFLAGGAIVVSSAIYYADMGMKTDEYFFSGFPVVWNMVIFTLFVVDAGQVTATAIVLISVVLTFLPIHFLHPVRVQRLRPVNLAVFFIWSGFGVYALLSGFDTPFWVKLGVSVSGLYLYFIGAVLQLFPTFGRKE